MCVDDDAVSQVPAVLHDFEPDVEIKLEPVDSVVVTTLMDNLTDIFMPDQGPARRAGVARGPWRGSAVMEGGQAPDALIAEHGFSVLVTVTKAGNRHRFLFDAGTSPDGVAENMRPAPRRVHPEHRRYQLSSVMWRCGVVVQAILGEPVGKPAGA